jgi:hypothetical protein
MNWAVFFPVFHFVRKGRAQLARLITHADRCTLGRGRSLHGRHLFRHWDFKALVFFRQSKPVF